MCSNDKSSDVDKLAEDVAKGLRVVDDNEDDDMTTKNLRQVAQWIKDGTCKRIMVLSGAGVSVAAGIPDFRTPGTGLYDNLQKYNLPYPEAVFDLTFFRKNPVPFCSLAKEIWPGLTHSPTLTHSFLALLAHHDKLVRNYTQNIDGLEILAQIDPDLVVECHGHFRTSTCIQCNKTVDSKSSKDNKPSVLDTIVKNGGVPKCLNCKTGIMKPDIVFFGEGLPTRFGNCLRSDIYHGKCDLLLIMGTSLQVAPVCNIPHMVGKQCKRVLFDRQEVGNFDFGRANSRDLFIQGDCDVNIQKLCKFLGWEDDLLKRNKETKIQSTTEKKET